MGEQGVELLKGSFLVGRQKHPTGVLDRSPGNLCHWLQHEPRQNDPGEPELTKAYLSELSSTLKCWVMGGMVAPAEVAGKGRNLPALIPRKGNCLLHYRRRSTKKMKNTRQARRSSFPSLGLQSVHSLRPPLPRFIQDRDAKKADLFVVIACWPKVGIDH